MNHHVTKIVIRLRKHYDDYAFENFLRLLKSDEDENVNIALEMMRGLCNATIRDIKEIFAHYVILPWFEDWLGEKYQYYFLTSKVTLSELKKTFDNTHECPITTGLHHTEISYVKWVDVKYKYAYLKRYETRNYTFIRDYCSKSYSKFRNKYYGNYAWDIDMTITLQDLISTFQRILEKHYKHT